MHGPQGAYAVNGHDRYYSAVDASDPSKRRYAGGFSVYSNSIIANVAGAHIDITREQAAHVLRSWREKGYTVTLAYECTKLTGPVCSMCDGTDMRLQPQFSKAG